MCNHVAHQPPTLPLSAAPPLFLLRASVVSQGASDHGRAVATYIELRLQADLVYIFGSVSGIGTS